MIRGKFVIGDKYLQGVMGDNEKIGLVKIDVEGHESSVIRGLFSTLKEHKPLVLFEALNRNAAETASEELKRCGYKSFYQLGPILISEKSEAKRLIHRLLVGTDLFLQEIRQFHDIEYNMILATTNELSISI